MAVGAVQAYERGWRGTCSKYYILGSRYWHRYMHRLYISSRHLNMPNTGTRYPECRTVQDIEIGRGYRKPSRFKPVGYTFYCNLVLPALPATINQSHRFACLHGASASFLMTCKDAHCTTVDARGIAAVPDSAEHHWSAA